MEGFKFYDTGITITVSETVEVTNNEFYNTMDVSIIAWPYEDYNPAHILVRNNGFKNVSVGINLRGDEFMTTNYLNATVESNYFDGVSRSATTGRTDRISITSNEV